ncbi:MAG: peptidoglycan DD-metalloendopeptidase family protein [Propionibacteriaceae bacterium]|jgi:murein DD-endopeptidase MepM/ murein hydrolase activator NlpD|nr:peptidoglycan DD-metalloendopeptidase family protein [Propionibacteriaceae bacterium]
MISRGSRIGAMLAPLVLILAALGAGVPANAAPDTLTVEDVNAQLDQLEQDQHELAARREVLEARLASSQNQLGATQIEIEARQARIDALKPQLARIALQVYQDLGLNSTMAVLTSDNTQHMLTQITMNQRVEDATLVLIQSLQLEQASLADAKRGLVEVIESIDADTAELVALEEANKQKAAEASDLLDRLTASAAAKAALAAARGGTVSTGAGADDGNGVADPREAVPDPSPRLVNPLPSAQLSSPFGMRVNPVTGVYELHDGTDLAAPCGTPVGAAGNGLVTQYYWHTWGGGNRMIVDNGIIDGHHIVTGYNHLSGAIAEVGDKVTQGQPIALVGSTGMSTGCHLHLQVWVDGQIVDALPYIQ